MAGLDESEKAAVLPGIRLNAELILIYDRKGAEAARRKGWQSPARSAFWRSQRGTILFASRMRSPASGAPIFIVPRA